MQVLQVELQVGPDPAEVGRARRWARSRLAGSGIGADEPLADTLLLLISELVTNAVVHTGCPAVLRIRMPAADDESAAVRVEVADASSRPPRPRHAQGDDTNGRGLELVDGLADRWGWQPEGAGKRIWCELDRTPGACTAEDDEAALLAVYGSYSAADIFEVPESPGALPSAPGLYGGRTAYS
ncbi:ATP-binding protein [Streptomyces sp. NPDC060194]|uniref:ATP-binding protein n=1 Tax=Streptomyces sp. NPDC060194 TaxID=3347069 RepID=UPI00365370B1